ncbi:MAG: hypothetical protein JW867_00040 [Candidatus Omnitrophica bacterium]|nr:hypothetical protein [Candidatus Omnitrophota bacterium]
MTSKAIDLGKLSEEDILKLRICQLPVKIEGTWLENCINDLYDELGQKGIIFRPLCYLADEWLTPDKEPIVGIPFFLADPALIRLEKKMVLEVEGGTKDWCMKLLRHETGHAINYAYKLYRRKKWQRIFGRFSQEYGDTYRYRPYSKNFVRHLEDYYAQYHPDEDFAETFAVWLTPESNWQHQYRGWRVLAKLNYVDTLMNEIKGKEPLVRKEKLYWQASKIRSTLKSFYKEKMHSYAEELPDFHDSNLKKIFVFTGADKEAFKKYKKSLKAEQLIRKYKKDIINNVARWTGEKKFMISGLTDAIIKRCGDLRLIVEKDEPASVIDITSYITTSVMNYLYTGGYRREY